MSQPIQQLESRGPALEAYLLGSIEYEDCLALQQRLVFELSGRNDGQIGLLLCEHPPIVTIGRQGSRAHLLCSDEDLTSQKLEVRWVNRGGGCWMHLPGQLAVYPIVPLFWYGYTVGDYLQRLQQGLLQALDEVRIKGQCRDHRQDIWGRTGQLVGAGVAVKNWTTYHGAHINVCPAMRPLRQVACDADGPQSSLTVERQRPVRMPKVREAVVRNLAASFDCPRFHLYTGHPLLHSVHQAKSRHEAAARAG